MSAAATVTSLVTRLHVLKSASHPLGLDEPRSRELKAALEGGASLADALRRAGADGPLARCLELARPGDAVTVADRLLPMLGEAHQQRLQLRSAALYPSMVLFCLGMVAGAIRAVALTHLRVMATDLGGPLPEVAVTVGFVAPLVLLGLLIVSISLELPTFPFVRVRVAIQRALVLEATAVLAEAGVALPLATRAAGLLASGPLPAAAAEVAQALEAGNAPHATALLDATSARLFHSGASRGVGPVVLHALAAQARVVAQQRVGFEVLRAQSVALVFAGLALAAVGIGWFSTYTHVLLLGGT